MREVVPTQSALLALREERAGMQEAYRFLDEKRLALAAELVSALRAHQELSERFRSAFAAAKEALQAALGRHGLEGLEVYPPLRLSQVSLRLGQRSVLGVPVQSADLVVGEGRHAWPPCHPSPEARHCAEAFQRLWPLVATLGATASNLARLREEYRRTARRARALEDVLLPEVDETMAALELSLEDLDREDAVRVRYRGGG